MRVVHYLNQFFGGIGGEEHAGAPLQARDGAVGPGRLLEQVLGGDSKVVRTIICGDNYAAEDLESLTEQVLKEVKDAGAELFVAGPCFEAGRYGVAAGALCAAVQAEFGIPVVTGMAVENPGVDLYRQELYIVDSGQNVAAMRDVLVKMAAIAKKIAANQEIGRPSAEGYIPRGIMKDEVVEKTAAERLVEMVLAKTKGEPYESELSVTTFEPIPAPPPVVDLSKATVAIVTDGGLVPKGNPDNMPAIAATIWGAYDISGQDDLAGGDYEIFHRGYDNRYVLQDPDRLVPVDVLKELEKGGVVGKVYGSFLSTTGLANPLANSRRLGREMAQKLKEAGVDAVILTST
jgi:glycine reductase